jgi:hypothetical protein
MLTLVSGYYLNNNYYIYQTLFKLIITLVYHLEIILLTFLIFALLIILHKKLLFARMRNKPGHLHLYILNVK